MRPLYNLDFPVRIIWITPTNGRHPMANKSPASVAFHDIALSSRSLNCGYPQKTRKRPGRGSRTSLYTKTVQNTTTTEESSNIAHTAANTTSNRPLVSIKIHGSSKGLLEKSIRRTLCQSSRKPEHYQRGQVYSQFGVEAESKKSRFLLRRGKKLIDCFFPVCFII